MVHFCLGGKPELDFLIVRSNMGHAMGGSIPPRYRLPRIFPTAYHPYAGKKTLFGFHFGQSILTDGCLHPVGHTGNRVGNDKRGPDMIFNRNIVAINYKTGISVDSRLPDNGTAFSKMGSGYIRRFEPAGKENLLASGRFITLEILCGHREDTQQCGQAHIKLIHKQSPAL